MTTNKKEIKVKPIITMGYYIAFEKMFCNMNLTAQKNVLTLLRYKYEDNVKIKGGQ